MRNDSGDFVLEKIDDINGLPYSLGKHLGQLCLNSLVSSLLPKSLARFAAVSRSCFPLDRMFSYR